MGILADRLFGLLPGARAPGRGTPAGMLLPAPPDERRADIIKWWTYYNGRDAATGRASGTTFTAASRPWPVAKSRTSRTPSASAPTVCGGCWSTRGGGSPCGRGGRGRGAPRAGA